MKYDFFKSKMGNLKIAFNNFILLSSIVFMFMSKFVYCLFSSLCIALRMSYSSSASSPPSRHARSQLCHRHLPSSSSVSTRFPASILSMAAVPSFIHDMSPPSDLSRVHLIQSDGSGRRPRCRDIRDRRTVPGGQHPGLYTPACVIRSRD